MLIFYATLLVGLATCYEQGIVFEGGQDVLLTDSYWRVTLEYNLTQVYEEAANISILLVEVKSHYDTFFVKILNENSSGYSPLVDLESSFRFEYLNLHQMVQEYMQEVNDLVTLLPKKRTKRGLIDAGGHLLKFLFGTLDSSDLETINEKMNALYDTTAGMVHDSEEQITVIGQMESELLSHAQTINRIIANLKQYHSKMHGLMHKVFAAQKIAETQLQNLFSYLKLKAALTDVKDSVMNAVHKIDKFQRAIESLAEGKLSEDLLSPHQYLTILHSIEKVLKEPAKLYLPVSMETLHNFYRVALVRSYATAHTLRVIVQIPVKNDEQLFQMYDVISYPVYDKFIGRWARWEVENQKLFISKDRLSYTLYREDKFEKECLKGELTVCPLAQVIMSTDKRPTCIVELFSSDEAKLCNRILISGLESPLLIRTPYRWLFSASKEHRVTLNCYGTDGLMNITSFVLKGVGELANVENCDVITEAFKVPARIHGSTVVAGELGRIKLPDIKSIFFEDEEKLLRTDVNETLDVLKNLDNELGTYGVREYHLERVLQHLRSRQFMFGMFRKNKLGTILCVIMGVTFLLIFCCLINRKGRKLGAWCLSCLFSSRKQRSADPTSPGDVQPDEVASGSRDVEMGDMRPEPKTRKPAKTK